MKDKIVLGLKIVFLVVIIGWIGLVLIDYFNARGMQDDSQKLPKFCIKQEIHVYDANGDLSNTLSMKDFNKMSETQKEGMNYTYECVGLGYKVYRYHREFKAIEFGPFFIQERMSVE